MMTWCWGGSVAGRHAWIALSMIGGVACSIGSVGFGLEGDFVVSRRPLDVGSRGAGICVAVQPGNHTGVWWWEAGASGCETRSTGPTVFSPERASVTPSGSGGFLVRFRLPLITGPDSTTPPHIDVQLTLADGVMTTAAGVRVETMQRGDLDIPEAIPGARR